MFIAAVVQGGGCSSPVKIRDMSAVGAQIESSVSLPPGSEIHLVRGRLAVPCVVVWTNGGRSGLKFLSTVSVGDWLAPPKNIGQPTVDEMVRLVKGGASPSQTPAEFVGGSTPAPTEFSAAELSQDLRRAALLIKMMGEELSSDEPTVARHGPSLQLLDIALQTISAAADSLSSSQADQAAAQRRLKALRTNCLAALGQRE